MSVSEDASQNNAQPEIEFPKHLAACRASGLRVSGLSGLGRWGFGGFCVQDFVSRLTCLDAPERDSSSLRHCFQDQDQWT